jgi:hypothetical protein
MSINGIRLLDPSLLPGTLWDSDEQVLILPSILADGPNPHNPGRTQPVVDDAGPGHRPGSPSPSGLFPTFDPGPLRRVCLLRNTQRNVRT